MKKVWIIVANSTQAKVYRAENTHQLVEHVIFYNDESHMHAKDLLSDRQGRESNRQGTGHSNWNSDTYESKTPVKLKAVISFAQTLSEFLEKKCDLGECERIYMFAKPPFLGHLREALSPRITKLIQLEINKDLTQASLAEIRDYLPPAL